MRLNNLQPNDGANKERRRVGRGVGSGLGKTAGRGHKGQHARAGGTHKYGFEGGQMPLNRRMPKVGFRSKSKAQSQEVFLYQLANMKDDVIDVVALHKAGLIDARARKVKVVLKGEIGRAVKLSGLLATAGAKAAIEAAGGSVE
ncbi:MAG TPA: 50S ribosomal protein L15 [Rhodanobacter sp.]|jgi:large subunit ribosomal protein L15|nr:50S ribosomal protein L15 [Rhodanobacter sp.]